MTVAILAALLFGESIGVVGAAGLALGLIGLLLLEVDRQNFSLNLFERILNLFFFEKILICKSL